MKKKAKNVIDPTKNGTYTPEDTTNKTPIHIPELNITLLVRNEKLKNTTHEQYIQNYINNYKNRDFL